MQIEFVDFVAGARMARGVTVVIDVFRAFSTACYCIAAGCDEIFAVGDEQRARALGARYPASVLLGERYGRRLPGFDFGNSPSEVASQSFVGKTVIHTTHAGTQGLVNAHNADIVLTGAFVNARATASYIRQLAPAYVTLVRMGLHASEPSDEDNMYADYLAALLRGEAVDERGIYSALRRSPYAARFFDPAQPWSPEADFDHCLSFNRFNFVLLAQTCGLDVCKLEKKEVA